MPRQREHRHERRGLPSRTRAGAPRNASPRHRRAAARAGTRAASRGTPRGRTWRSPARSYRQADVVRLPPQRTRDQQHGHDEPDQHHTISLAVATARTPPPAEGRSRAGSVCTRASQGRVRRRPQPSRWASVQRSQSPVSGEVSGCSRPAAAAATAARRPRGGARAVGSRTARRGQPRNSPFTRTVLAPAASRPASAHRSDAPRATPGRRGPGRATRSTRRNRNSA